MPKRFMFCLPSSPTTAKTANSNPTLGDKRKTIPTLNQSYLCLKQKKGGVVLEILLKYKGRYINFMNADPPTLHHRHVTALAFSRLFVEVMAYALKIVFERRSKGEGQRERAEQEASSEPKAGVPQVTAYASYIV